MCLAYFFPHGATSDDFERRGNEEEEEIHAAGKTNEPTRELSRNR